MYVAVWCDQTVSMLAILRHYCIWDKTSLLGGGRGESAMTISVNIKVIA
jgi:hypothetical protein